MPRAHRSLETHIAVRISARCHAFCWELGEACLVSFGALVSCHTASDLRFSASCDAFCFRLNARLEPTVTLFVSLDTMSLERAFLLVFNVSQLSRFLCCRADFHNSIGCHALCLDNEDT